MERYLKLIEYAFLWRQRIRVADPSLAGD